MENDDQYVAWCCEVDGRIVGELFLCRRPDGDMRVPMRSIDLSSASVQPAFRRRGIASALACVALEWAQANGIETIITDWRATNLTAARTWPNLGFEPTFIRLYRSIP
jgi:GNAT superfamily N-acetyltransferase